jgi:PleD family two-component response regulator
MQLVEGEPMRACAYVVGPPDGPGAALRDMARGLGFPAVLAYAGLSAAETQAQQTPLLFFLFAAVDEVNALKHVADTIRFSPNRRIRFCPLVYFSESPSVEQIRRCIEMGFDDVITLPFTQPRVVGRLDRLIDRTQVYHETAAYLGPERRMSAADGRDSQYRRLEIIRSATTGVSVLRDEMRAGASAVA